MKILCVFLILFAFASAARAHRHLHPCTHFHVKVDGRYKIRLGAVEPIRATRTYPLDGDQCIINNNTDGCCLTDKKYMSIHTEILDNTRPRKGETNESLYIATFAAPAEIAKYTTVSNFSIVNVTPRGFKYEICYESIDPRSGRVGAELLILKDNVKDVKDNNHDDGTSILGRRCQICPNDSGNNTVISPNATFCGPAFMWDPFSRREPRTVDCYHMVSPSLLAISPVCSDAGSNASFVQRFRSFACQETSDTGYRVSGRVVTNGTTVTAEGCYVGTGQ